MEDEDGVNLCLLFLCIFWYNSCRENHYLTRSAVVPPDESPWCKVLDRGDDTSFLNLSGMTRAAFYKLEGILFSPEPVGKKRGRPPILDNAGMLGMYLFYVGSTMKTKHICLIFGVLPSSANVIIGRMRSLLCLKLKNHETSKICWPTDMQMEEWAGMIRVREPTVRHVIGFCDGVAIHIQCSDSEVEQSKAYNGLTPPGTHTRVPLYRGTLYGSPDIPATVSVVVRSVTFSYLVILYVRVYAVADQYSIFSALRFYGAYALKIKRKKEKR